MLLLLSIMLLVSPIMITAGRRIRIITFISRLVLLLRRKRRLLLLLLFLGHVSMLDVGVQISLRKICSPASVVAVSGPVVGTHVNGAQAGLFDPNHFVVAPVAFALVGADRVGAPEAEHVLARDHPAVDQDRLQAFIAAMNHRVYHLQSEITVNSSRL